MKTTLLSGLFTLLFSAITFAQPSFTANTYSGCAPLNVDFTNQTPFPGSNTYQWDFDDGNSSTQIDPSHTFQFGGEYRVIMHAWNGQGLYMGYHEEYINVYGASNTFNVNKDTVCINEEVEFWEAFGPNAPNTSYTIDFGDGSPIESNNWGSFYHEYTSPGNYTVDYTYITSCGTGTAQRVISVGANLPVTDAFVQAGQNPNNSDACPGDLVDFYTNWDYNWIIDFGDGNVSSNGNSQHAYAQPGTYIVTAVVQNGCGNTGTAVDTINITNNVPISNSVYMGNESPACPNSEVDFWTDNGFSSYLWDFGGGLTSTDVSPSIPFQSVGNYNVSLTITNGCGNDTTLFDVVTINNSIFITDAEFDMQDSVCLGEPIYYDVDAENEESYLWNFGDGNSSTVESGSHLYASAGTYNVSVLMENGCGNDTTITTTVYVGTDVGFNPNTFAVGVFPEEACPGDTVVFFTMPAGVATNYTWTFGDGNSANGGQLLNFGGEISLDFTEHAYTSNGTYEIIYEATNACGYTVTDTIPYSVGPGAEPEATVVYDEDVYNCLGAPVTLMSAGGSSFTWDFGDGSGTLVTTGTLEPIEHIYGGPGTYTVSVTTTNSCGLTDEQDVEIFIPDNSIQLTTTSTPSNCGVSNGLAVVSIAGGNGPFEIHWSNGDIGNIADSLSAGIYQVTVYDANGCVAEAVATVSDVEAPTIVLNALLDVTCHGDNNGALDINLIGSSAPYNFLWSNGSSAEDVHNLAAGPHEVVVTDANGCISTESFTITEPEPVNISFTNTASDCGNDNGTSTVNVNGNSGPYLFSWQDGSSNSTKTNLGPGVYPVNVIDANGCLFSATTTISETNAPLIILDSLTQDGCGGSLASVYINPVGGQQPYQFNWSDGSTNEDLTNVQSGTYFVEVTGNNGCTSVGSYAVTEFTPNPIPICLVTVNPWSGNNMLVWEKDNLDPAVESFNIYRESSQSGVYFNIGNWPVDSLSQFVDSNADPSTKAYRYKISALDSCGNESLLSTDHTTLHLTSNLGISGEVNLIWSHYVGFSYSTYYVWRYTDIDGWNMIQPLANTFNSFTDFNVPAGYTDLSYYIEATPDVPCVSSRANHNTTRSNRTQPISGPSNTPLNLGSIDLDDISIYPNPSNGQVNLMIPDGIHLEMNIVDVNGKVVYQDRLNGGMNQMNLDFLSNGMYTIILKTDHEMVSKRLVING